MYWGGQSVNGLNLQTSEFGIEFFPLDNQSVLEFLVEKNANVNFPDSLGCTPLHIACNLSRSGSFSRAFVLIGFLLNLSFLAMVKFLLIHGSRVNAKSDEDATPLHWACLR